MRGEKSPEEGTGWANPGRSQKLQQDIWVLAQKQSKPSEMLASRH